MKRTFVLALALLWAAAPASAQLVNFPVYALPSANGAPSTFIAATYGRGLNDTSGKQNAFAAVIGRTGIADRISVDAGVGMITYDPDSKYTFGGNVAIDVLPAGGSAQVSVQGGVGYISLATDNSVMNFPIGVAIKTMVESDSGGLSLWAMPRLNISRVKYNILSVSGSDTSSDLGISGGASFTTSGGFGVHAAIDMLATDPSATYGGVGIHFVIP